MTDERIVAVRNFLFVCSQNKLRSPTAEHIFADYAGIATLSAGTDRDAEELLSSELIDWADRIFVMETRHRKKIQREFRNELHDKPIVVLNIRDEYEFMAPELTQLLKQKMQTWLG